jgi:hypothetical protein
VLRKWEYMAKALKNLKAPGKVINAAQELDSILVNLGLDYNTRYWIAYTSQSEYQDECWYSLLKVLYNATYCSACFDIDGNEVDCSCCILSKGMNTVCTPRGVYADDYYSIVANYINASYTNSIC